MRAESVRSGHVNDLHGKPVLSCKYGKESAEQLQFVARLVEHNQDVRGFVRIRERPHKVCAAGIPFAQTDLAGVDRQRNFGKRIIGKRKEQMMCGAVEPFRSEFFSAGVEKCQCERPGAVVKIEKQRVRCSAGNLHADRFALSERHGRDRVPVGQMSGIRQDLLRRGKGARKRALRRGKLFPQPGGRQQQQYG